MPRVRFAPSPTGSFHIGNARTALFNWIFARQNDGVFVLRIEDTDKERSKPEYENEIVEGLKWLKLDWDEFYRQSERKEIYKKYLRRLLEEKKAYYCYCSKEKLEAEAEAMRAEGLPPKYSGHCRNIVSPPAGARPEVIRFKTPEAVVEFNDLVRGKISFDAVLFGDMVIAKDLDTPLYNFASAVDDHEMKITHVIRGEDHLSNTPKQILLQKALGFGNMIYAHLPLILSSDRSKLSKRYAETSLLKYREEGYLPEAIINFLALLGWHPKEDKEILSIDELVKEFSVKKVQKAGAVFNQEKLDWLNSYYLHNMSVDDLFSVLQLELAGRGVAADKEFVKKVIEEEKPRLKKIGDFWGLTDFFFEMPEYDSALLVWKEEPKNKTREILGEAVKILRETVESDFNRNSLMLRLAELIEINGKGSVLWPLRVALSGKSASPDPLAIMEILGKEESLNRIAAAADKLG